MTITPHSPASASDSLKFQRDLVALIPQLRAFSRSLCGGRHIAEDLAQDALTKAWRARASFEPGTNLKAWLFTILRNAFYSQARTAWRQGHWDAEASENIPAPADEQDHAVALSDTVRALYGLSDTQRESVLLVGVGGFSYEDAAKICGTPVGTIKSRVARGRLALIEALDGTAPLPQCPTLPLGGAANSILAQLSALTPAGAHSAAYA